MIGLAINQGIVLSSASRRALAISGDGFIRLQAHELVKLAWRHLYSEIDQHTECLASEGAIAATLTGFTEWAAGDTAPLASLSWDWQLSGCDGETLCLRVGETRCNLMLITVEGKDIGFDATCDFLAQVIDELAWQAVVLDAVLPEAPKFAD